jgi:hypothetical protein
MGVHADSSGSIWDGVDRVECRLALVALDSSAFTGNTVDQAITATYSSGFVEGPIGSVKDVSGAIGSNASSPADGRARATTKTNGDILCAVAIVGRCSALEAVGSCGTLPTDVAVFCGSCVCVCVCLRERVTIKCGVSDSGFHSNPENEKSILKRLRSDLTRGGRARGCKEEQREDFVGDKHGLSR